jgi:hypothetical protein
LDCPRQPEKSRHPAEQNPSLAINSFRLRQTALAAIVLACCQPVLRPDVRSFIIVRGWPSFCFALSPLRQISDALYFSSPTLHFRVNAWFGWASSSVLSR